ncbi:MAG: AAC(3) family N-acetyltransferase [Candidatus Melainabacteria bacterium]|nr:AAC(3) family N-acetyltransferase [Candidatus Melainabacteria bacterium]
MSTGFTVLNDILDQLDIQPGDLVLLHSSFRYLRYLGMSPQEILQTILQRLSEEGTLVLPSYSWNLDRWQRPWKGYKDYFEQRPVFDLENTASNLGVLCECFRKMPDVRRSLHYWWSICARGPLAAELTARQEKIIHPFGPGSSYDLLQLHGVKLLGLGVTLNTSSLAFVPDFQLGDGHTQSLFTHQPIKGLVVDEFGQTRETNSFTLLPEVVRAVKPQQLIECSAVLSKAVRRADFGVTIQFSYSFSLYCQEALRLGRDACKAGSAVPWLLEYPLKVNLAIGHRMSKL